MVEIDNIRTNDWMETMLKEQCRNLTIISSSRFNIRLFLVGSDLTHVFWEWLRNNIKSFGWYIAKKQHERHPHLTSLQGTTMQIETLYTEIVACPQYLYHVTTKDRLKSIFEDGLVPTCEKPFDIVYPPRVYLTLNKDSYIKEMLSIAKKRKIEEYITLEIDRTKVPGAVWWLDPQYINKDKIYNSVYSDVPIPREAIKQCSYE